MENDKKQTPTLFLVTERLLLIAYFAVAILFAFKKIQISKEIFIFTVLPFILIKTYNIWKFEDGNYIPMIRIFLIHIFFIYRLWSL